MLKIENGTKWVLSAIILTSVLGYIFASFGNSNAVLWMFAVLGILLGLGLYSESAVVEYIRQKRYKNVNFADFFVWAEYVFVEDIK